MTNNDSTQITGFKFKPKFKPRNTENSELTNIQKQQRINRKEEFEHRMKKLEDKKEKRQVFTKNQMVTESAQQEFQLDTRVEEKIDLRNFRFDKQLPISDVPLKEFFHNAHHSDSMTPVQSQEFHGQVHMLCMPPLPKITGNGIVGKIRVRKSGKCELVIGTMVFDLTMGIQSQMLQRVIQTQVYGESRMIDFGDISSKIVASVQIE